MKLVKLIRDPLLIIFGLWFDAWYDPVQIIGSTTLNLMGSDIDVWIATSGYYTYYYDIESGVLVKYNEGYYNKFNLVDTNLELGFITTTTTTSALPSITSTTESSTKSEDKGVSIPSPNYWIISFTLLSFVMIIRRGRKK